MRNRVKAKDKAKNPPAPAKWFIVVLLILLPPVGFYFMIKYHKRWVKSHTAFTVGFSAYFFLIILGSSLANAPKNKIEAPNIKADTKVTDEAIDYQSITVETGEPKAGETGNRRIEYLIKKKDNTEVGRIILKDEITKEPIDEVIVKSEAKNE
ncbi:MAG: G5 domain-containing protein [Candidatus Saccharibacteria bacterium]|nr:G5 domain-containing protein [Candidatus Saccharibacteria bacterium]